MNAKPCKQPTTDEMRRHLKERAHQDAITMLTYFADLLGPRGRKKKARNMTASKEARRIADNLRRFGP